MQEFPSFYLQPADPMAEARGLLGSFGQSSLAMPKMTMFFGAENPLSNWHPARFVVSDVEFHNAEMFMMYCKARLFGDEQTAKQILVAKTPREHKALGRQVKGFDEGMWNQKRELYVRNGCYAKFSQNPHLRQFLLETAGT